MHLSISREGITFSYNNDLILWQCWFWLRSSTRAEAPFYSYGFGFSFKHFRDYWLRLGEDRLQARTLVSKVRGVSYGEVLKSWARISLRSGIFVVLYDTSLDLTPRSLVILVPAPRLKELYSDVVVLNCESIDQALDIANSVKGRGLATALIFSDGKEFITGNREDDTIV